MSDPLTCFEIQIYFPKKPRFNCIYSENNLPEIKDEAYITNVHEWKSIGIHLIVFYVNFYNVTYFGSSGVDYIPKD